MASSLLPIAPLKEKLIKDQIISPEIFDALVAEAEGKGQNFFDLLLAKNVVTAQYLNAFVASTLGVSRANFAGQAPAEDVVNLLPEEIARQRQAIVFGREQNGALAVALTNPNDLETIKFLAQYLGRPVKPYLATKEELNQGFLIYGKRLTQDWRKIIDAKIAASLRGQIKSAEEAAAQLPVVEVVDSLLSYALALRASDIHLEIMEETSLVRCRIDGLLYEIMKVNKAVHPALVARLKLLSGLKIDEHFKAQDGRFRYTLGNKVVDIRVSIIPTFYGEKVEMRLLEGGEKPLSLDDLGMSSEARRLTLENLSKAYGMVLVCGPTGAGKTTTLYSFINIVNRPEANLTTIEDPIEYNIPRVNQIQINPQGGMTFANGLRAILRQDPNVIMVGEIRDGETANISVQAALTGHLLLSSLHTNDAPTAIPRLLDLKIPAFLLAAVLNLIVAQRLVRKICQACVYSYPAGPELVKVIAEQLGESNLTAQDRRLPRTLYKGKGCEVCGFSGYRGRLGIFEALEMTEEVKREVINPQFSLVNLTATVRQLGMKTIFEDGLEKVQLAITTIEEVLRVIRE